MCSLPCLARSPGRNGWSVVRAEDLRTSFLLVSGADQVQGFSGFSGREGGGGGK